MTKRKRYYTMLQMLLNYWQKSCVLNYRPFRLWIEATNLCNLNCVMCLNNSDKIKKRGFMELTLFKKIIDEAKDFVYSVNRHHRGESLMHKDLNRMIEYCHDNGIYSQLHTNATLLSKKRAYEIITSGLDFISFSFDGYDKQTYESIRIGANFERTLENIKNFLKIKSELRNKTPFTVFETINFSSNVNHQDKNFREGLLSLGLDKFIIKQPHNWAGECESCLPDKKYFNKKDTYSTCTFPWYALVILWDGTVVVCPQDFFGEIIVGDINVSTLTEMWNNSSMINFRKKMKEKRYREFDPCISCDRLRRPSFLAVPTSHLRAFLKESLFM